MRPWVLWCLTLPTTECGNNQVGETTHDLALWHQKVMELVGQGEGVQGGVAPHPACYDWGAIQVKRGRYPIGKCMKSTHASRVSLKTMRYPALYSIFMLDSSGQVKMGV